MSFGKRIRAARIKLGLSQPMLAKAAKMNVMTISRFETGVRKGLRVSTLFRLAAALKSTPEYLMHGTKRKPVHVLVGGIEELVDVCKDLSPEAIATLISAARKLQQ